jgi:two-component system sensor histidine kinase YesM
LTLSGCRFAAPPWTAPRQGGGRCCYTSFSDAASLRSDPAPKTPEVHISIDLSYGDDTVIIVITDNGIGMAKEQLLELQKTLDEKIVNYEKHFGIGNVNKRISNPYFGNGRISVESCLYEGTSITIEFDQMEKYDEECNDCR